MPSNWSRHEDYLAMDDPPIDLAEQQTCRLRLANCWLPI
jgi:hypothetical protein